MTASVKRRYLCGMARLDELKFLVKGTLSEALPDYLDSEEALLQWLIGKIEQLIATDFEALLFLLYRIDVSEQKVRQMLAATGGEAAARTIAELIIERQKQKLLWREKFRQQPLPPGDEDERW
jgi:hypothetical protein